MRPFTPTHGNLLYAFPTLSPREFDAHVDVEAAEREGRTAAQVGDELGAARTQGLTQWGLSEADARAFHDSVAVRVITPGNGGGEALHVLSSLDLPSPLWSTDREAAKQSLAATISLLLRLVGRDPDPTRSRDHVVLSKFAELRLSTGKPAGLEALLHDLGEPPVEEIGALALDEYPPAKRPLLALMKQARAFGVGIVIATQNPMDLDYRALSNAGCWWIGRLQTDADRERVVEGLAGLDGGNGVDREALDHVLKRLAPRWFVMRDVHRKPAMALVQTRWTFTWMRGPMTRTEIKRALVRS